MSKHKHQTGKAHSRPQNKSAGLVIGVGLVVMAFVMAASVMDFNGGSRPASAGAGDDAQPLPGLISPAQYMAHFADASPASNYILVDVRTPEEFNAGHIAGAVNIPVEVIGQRLNEIPADQTVVLYCRSGNRSATAANVLRRAGYGDVYDIAGGVIAWANANLPLE